MCEKKVLEFCIKYGINSCKLLLAVSGGCDSISLLYIFSNLKKKLNFYEIGIIHVNHCLRLEESKKEKKFVAQLAKQFGYKFHYKKLTGKTLNDSGIENWARKERYRFFLDVKNKNNYDFIATGHNANDQAETILMKIARGCGIKGLGGIQHFRDDGVIRPLIKLQRHTLESYLKTRGKSWLNDSTNYSLKYTRNRVRHSLIPFLLKMEPNSMEYLSELTQYVQKMLHFLYPLINKWVNNSVIEECDNKIVLDKSFLQNKNFLVYESIVQLFNRKSIPYDKKTIIKFVENSKKNKGEFLLKNKWQYFPGKTKIVIVKDQKNKISKINIKPCVLNVPGITYCNQRGFYFIIKSIQKKECALNYDRENKTVFIDADKINFKLLFREVCKTDVFQPLGFYKPIPIIEYLKKQKISKFFRQYTGVIADTMGEIVWIPEIALGHKYRITSKTKNVFRISFRRIS